MGRAYSTYGTKVNAYRILVGNPENHLAVGGRITM
jgi:hypothetical protein